MAPVESNKEFDYRTGRWSIPEIAKTLDQGLMLLDAVAEHGPGTVADLADRSGLNRTVTHRLVATLEQRGFLRRAEDGRVGLGPTLLDLGDRVETDLRAAARIPLQVLTARTRETAVLTVPDGAEAVAIEQNSGFHHLLRVDYRPGFRHPLDRAAHGKVILAFMPVPPTDLDDDEAKRIRRRGYATSHDELQLGAAGLAAPVFGRGGTVIASIGVVAPLDRMPSEREAARAVLEAAADASRNLGFHVPRASCRTGDDDG